MPAPNLGNWDIVYDGDTPLNTQQTAVHANLIYNSNTGKWMFCIIAFTT